MLIDRWEHGSELSCRWDYPPTSEEDTSPWRTAERYATFGTGRDALRALLRLGSARGWKRLWVPSYLCQEVVGAAALEVPVLAYEDRPGMTPAQRRVAATAGDAVYVCNTFGLRNQAWSLDLPGVEVIEDHTHDPWSDWAQQSQADFALASLRKCLPLPSGAVLWSPRNRSLPTAVVTVERERASLSKLAGQLLKQQYLDGQNISKGSFRDLATVGESEIACGAPSGMPTHSLELLHTFPVVSWRKQRQANYEQAASEDLGDSVELLCPEPGAQGFSLTLLLGGKEKRDRLRSALIRESVFPAVLWPLDAPIAVGVTDADKTLSNSLLSIHCDFRYDAAHMTELLRRLANASKGL